MKRPSKRKYHAIASLLPIDAACWSFQPTKPEQSVRLLFLPLCRFKAANAQSVEILACSQGAAPVPWTSLMAALAMASIAPPQKPCKGLFVRQPELYVFSSTVGGSYT